MAPEIRKENADSLGYVGWFMGENLGDYTKGQSAILNRWSRVPRNIDTGGAVSGGIVHFWDDVQKP